MLEHLYDKYNRPEFIEPDPISVPHAFEGREDREIAGFLAATIAWGNRKAIVRSARRMVEYMDNAPAVSCATPRMWSWHGCELCPPHVQRRRFPGFVMALRRITELYGGIGAFFESRYEATGDLRQVMSEFRREFFSCEHNPHCEKHLSSIDKGAACKRLNMYLRWFVRRDDRGVDFGLWRRIPMSALYLPLDDHSGNMGRALGLLHRRQNDWKATEEITASLREFDAEDPVRYDFSLFGAGIDGFLK